ncbi:MAG: hypothetical protein ACRELV_09805 [Longimicrobiales bacterium]
MKVIVGLTGFFLVVAISADIVTGIEMDALDSAMMEIGLRLGLWGVAFIAAIALVRKHWIAGAFTIALFLTVDLVTTYLVQIQESPTTIDIATLAAATALAMFMIRLIQDHFASRRPM